MPVSAGDGHGHSVAINSTSATKIITDPAGKWKTYTYDASGNLIQVTEPGSLATLYTYDVLNHLTQVSNSKNTSRFSIRTLPVLPTVRT